MAKKTKYGTKKAAAQKGRVRGSVFQTKDVNAKKVFGNPYLCAQFLRDYSNLDAFRDVQPEDIEKVNLRYHLFQEVEYHSDTVVRIRRNKGKAEPPIYIAALVDHKSEVDYNVGMQLLCYMICIWKDWEKEMKKDYHISCKSKDFRYPIIYPVVYYEGSGTWTASLHFADRIYMSDILPQYVPDFTYQVVRPHDYSNAQLLEKNDEISLVMLLNKIQQAGDFEEFRNEMYQEVARILEKAPESVVNIIAEIARNLCQRLNVPEDETNDYISRIRGEKDMGYFFENMEKMDIQEERRLRKAAQDEAKKAKEELEEAQSHAKEAENHAKEAENHAKEAENHAKEIESRAKEAASRAKEAASQIKVETYIETLQEMSVEYNEAKNKAMAKFCFDEQQAEAYMQLYWKEI